MKRIKTEDFEEFDEAIPRTEEEIWEAIEKLFDQVWYNRHLNLKFNLEQGVETVSPEIWEIASKAAQRVQSKYAASELGPWTDFEWGMLNGKLSALRWVLGSSWDDLDS